jgi:hypothetical protein
VFGGQHADRVTVDRDDRARTRPDLRRRRGDDDDGTFRRSLRACRNAAARDGGAARHEGESGEDGVHAV